MSFDSEEYKKMMAEMKQNYVNKLQDHIVGINEALEAKDAEKLREQFHKFKGNGLTYGVPEISVIGELAENLFKDNPERGFAGTPFAVKLLQAVYEKESKAQDYDFDGDPNLAELKAA